MIQQLKIESTFGEEGKPEKMENTCSRSSSGTPSPAAAGRAPAYLRLSSEVVEKASHADESSSPEFGIVLQPEMVEISPAMVPGSPASASSKSDNEGIHFMSVPGLVEYYLAPAALSDVEMEQGDVDEGFDEEFGFEEEDDVKEADPAPGNHFQLGDLDPKELQQLLNDPELPNLEDFDLGVDVLDSEQPILSPSMRTSGSYPPTPRSPYLDLSSSANLNMNTFYNDYNLSESFCGEDPPSVCSDISSALTTASGHAEDLSLAMLAAECDMLPDSTSTGLLGVVPETMPTAGYHQQSSPVLGTAGGGGLDLSETSHLLSAETLIELSAALSSEANVDTQSMYMFGNGSAHLNLSLNSQQSGSGTSVITLLDSSMLPRCSQASQTTLHNDRTTFSPLPPQTPLPPTASSPGKVRRHSRSPSAPTELSMLSEEDRQLIDMPYYQFRKLLDDPSIPEGRKEDIKNVRRKGRNKMAAKVCRTKKVCLIMGLEQEVEQLRKAKSQISTRTMSLEREIAELKRKCLNR